MDLESRLALEADEAAVEAFLAEHDGLVQRDEQVPGRYWLTMRPRSASAERFHVCVGWNVYPHRPPSVTFADAVGGNVAVPWAWPAISGYAAGSFICKPFTSEGFGRHPEWERGPEAWRPTGNPFLWVVQVLQDDLDHRYGGRAA
jgi:hypothetical protein